MSERTCPVCGDPRPYRFWQDSMEPPCPYGAYKVTDCSHQMQDARRAAAWLRIAPDCHGGDGAVLPGKLGEVLTRVAAAGVDVWTGEHQPRETRDE